MNARHPSSAMTPDAKGCGDGPLAFFLTFHTYGTWLHGDDRGSVDRAHIIAGTPGLPGNDQRRRLNEARLRFPPVVLDARAREIVARTMQEVADHSGWTIHALAVRSNHVHVVLSALQMPERAMNALKSWASRRLVEAQAHPAGAPVWVRHGSTKYIWRSQALRDVCEYVEHGQGGEL